MKVLILVLSLFSIAAKGQASLSQLIPTASQHLALAQLKDSQVQLFEAQTLIQMDRDTVSYLETKFSHPQDSAEFIDVREGLLMNATEPEVKAEPFSSRLLREYYLSRGSEIVEEAQFHQPIKNWKVDLSAVREIMNNSRLSWNQLVLMRVVTFARAKRYGFFEYETPAFARDLISRLSALKDDHALILVANRTAWPGSSLYMVIDAETGKILASGTYKRAPPPVGAVSSGG